MSPFPQVLQFLVVAVAGWINQQPRDALVHNSRSRSIIALHPEI